MLKVNNKGTRTPGVILVPQIGSCLFKLTREIQEYKTYYNLSFIQLF